MFAVLRIAAALAFASSASAQTVLTFDDLPAGAVIAHAYSQASFSSSFGNSNFVLNIGAGDHILITGSSLLDLDGEADTYVDFMTPVDGLSFRAIQPNGTGVVARFRIFENGVHTATEDLIGLGGAGGEVAVDLGAYSHVTRLEIVDILVSPQENGIGWDDFAFTPSATSSFYCTAKTNSQGCTPILGFTGNLQASGGNACNVVASSVLSHKPGLLFYGKNGPAALPFQGGLLCIAAPRHRTGAVQDSGGAHPLDCSGTYSFDFNAWIASGADPALVAGQHVWLQYFSRDPGFAAPGNSGFTGGLELVIAP
ncbi:MAG: hypothetical protein K8S98_10205 [Planctomycetes bacterium]|nr:hypothetical protein [Planctomycetota bacterium]